MAGAGRGTADEKTGVPLRHSPVSPFLKSGGSPLPPSTLDKTTQGSEILEELVPVSSSSTTRAVMGRRVAEVSSQLGGV